jgi:hypothetical protein
MRLLVITPKAVPQHLMRKDVLLTVRMTSLLENGHLKSLAVIRMSIPQFYEIFGQSYIPQDDKTIEGSYSYAMMRKHV